MDQINTTHRDICQHVSLVESITSRDYPMRMNTLGDRLKVAIKEKGTTQAALQAEMGWGDGNSRVGNYASDKREPSLADIEQLAKALGVSKEWLAFNSGDMRGMPSDESVIPFHHDMRASAGPGAYNDAGVSDKGLKFQNWSLARRRLQAENMHAWVVSGTSMAPYIPDRSTIVFDVSDRVIKDGSIYVINWGGETFVKRLYRELDGRVRVVSDNSSDPTNRDRLTDLEADGFIVEGRVRWVGFWLD